MSFFLMVMTSFFFRLGFFPFGALASSAAGTRSNFVKRFLHCGHVFVSSDHRFMQQ